MRVLTLALLLTAFVPCSHSQGISPLVTELKAGKKDTKTAIHLINASVFPLTAVLEPHRLTFDNGKASILPLDSGIHLKLSETTLKIPPKQTRDVLISVSCDILPCAFTLTSIFQGAHTLDGIGIRVSLGSAYYVCTKQKGCRDLIMQQPTLVAQKQ
jgi:hypothetical protein